MPTYQIRVTCISMPTSTGDFLDVTHCVLNLQRVRFKTADSPGRSSRWLVAGAARRPNINRQHARCADRTPGSTGL